MLAGDGIHGPKVALVEFDEAVFAEAWATRREDVEALFTTDAGGIEGFGLRLDSMLEQLTAEDSFPTRAIRSSLDDGHLQLPLADLTGFAALALAEAREDRDDTLPRLPMTRDWLPAADVVD